MIVKTDCETDGAVHSTNTDTASAQRKISGTVYLCGMWHHTLYLNIFLLSSHRRLPQDGTWHHATRQESVCPPQEPFVAQDG